MRWCNLVFEKGWEWEMQSFSKDDRKIRMAMSLTTFFGIFLVKLCGTFQGRNRNPASFEEW